ncbi:MAG: carbon storage regulator [Planctomycetaceae bacterium]
MLVLSRHIGESLRIDGDLLVTLAVVGRDFVELAVSTENQSKPRLVTVGVGRKVSIADAISITLVMNTGGKVRLGIDAPRGTTFERPEFDE